MENNQTMKDLTAKDKAKELWTTYRFALSIKNAPLGEQKDLIAKQCALIAVDNEIKSIIWLNLWCGYDNYMKEHIQNKILELQDVKSEIEKL